MTVLLLVLDLLYSRRYNRSYPFSAMLKWYLYKTSCECRAGKWRVCVLLWFIGKHIHTIPKETVSENQNSSDWLWLLIWIAIMIQSEINNEFPLIFWTCAIFFDHVLSRFISISCLKFRWHFCFWFYVYPNRRKTKSVTSWTLISMKARVF